LKHFVFASFKPGISSPEKFPVHEFPENKNKTSILDKSASSLPLLT